MESSADGLWLEIDSIRSDSWQHLLNDGLSALDWRLRAIDSATQSIDFQTFIWDVDTTGRMLLDHVLTAADRGVRIRILVDDSFLFSADQLILGLDGHPNIQFRVFNPYKRRVDNVLWREILNAGDFHRLDHRMHNKVLIVDNRSAIVGGRNIADEYFGLHASANFRDIELLSGGPLISDISDGFDRYWNDPWVFPAASLTDAAPSDDALDNVRALALRDATLHVEQDRNQMFQAWLTVVRDAHSGSATLLIDDPPEDNPAQEQSAPIQLAASIYDLIDSARSEVWILSAYLVPTKELESAIERAEDRGVAVHILTNSIRSNNHISAHSAYRRHVQRLVAHGADLHEVRVDASDRGTYMLEPVEEKALALHAKVMVIDRRQTFIGSANFDPRSLKLNTEMGLLIDSIGLAEQVRALTAVDFDLHNAWHLRLTDANELQWLSSDEVLNHQPAASFMQHIEDWFFALLPIEGEM